MRTRRSWSGSATALLPSPDTVVQDGDIDLRRRAVRRHSRRSPSGRRLPDGRFVMRIAIAGAGSVGRSIAGELVENGHQVMLIDRDPEAIKPERIEAAEWVQADACELSLAGGGRPADLRRGDRLHRRRQGQPGGVAAGQDRVRGRPRGRPGQRPAQRVAVHRRLGRRRGGVDTAHPGRAGRGGRDGRRPGAAVHPAPGSGQPGRGHPAAAAPAWPAGRCATCGCPGTPPW